MSVVFPSLTFFSMPVFATSGSDSSSSSSGSGSSSDSSSTDDSKLTPEQVAQKAAALKQRLEDNKTKLDDATKKRITLKCKSAQGVVKGAETSAEAISKNRKQAYTKIAEAVQKLIDRLKSQGKDTSELEGVLAVAKQKAEALGTAMTTYQQTLSDLRSMDCATDPAAFSATLETARTQRDAVKAAATELRTYISVTLKAAVNKIKSQLESEKTSQSSTTQEGVN